MEGIGTPTPKEETELSPSGEFVETEEQQQDVKASDFLKGNTRQEGELYCDYKARLYWEKMLSKQYFGGRTIWVGAQRGEARNPERRLRDSKKKLRKNAQKERVRLIREAQGVLTPEQVKCLNRKRKKAFIRACEK
jgi:hypothetical protein